MSLGTCCSRVLTGFFRVLRFPPTLEIMRLDWLLKWTLGAKEGVNEPVCTVLPTQAPHPP